MRMEPSNVRKKGKGTTQCDKRIVICDVGIAQCEEETIKCEKKKVREPPNVRKELSHVMLELHNVRIKLSVDTQFCTNDLIKENDLNDHPCTPKIMIALHVSICSCITCINLFLHYMH